MKSFSWCFTIPRYSVDLQLRELVHGSTSTFQCASFELYLFFVLSTLETHSGWILFQFGLALDGSSFCVAFLGNPKHNFSMFCSSSLPVYNCCPDD